MIRKQQFKEEVLSWAKEIGVEPNEIQLREMTRKWASCSSKGRLTFSYELLNETYPIRSKAIVHELLHLRYPHHTKMFKSIMFAHLRKKGIELDNVKLLNID